MFSPSMEVILEGSVARCILRKTGYYPQDADEVDFALVPRQRTQTVLIDASQVSGYFAVELIRRIELYTKSFTHGQEGKSVILYCPVEAVYAHVVHFCEKHPALTVCKELPELRKAA